ncbi:MAG: PAS domain S-box protein, partial [Candidatus Thermoplasmatota archaeon]|nr:PAS domain S-box protein [Candidatus Thermoplasmatota archaeon]
MAQKKKTSIQINANDLSKISGISQTFISDQHFLAVLQQLIDALPVILVLIDPKDYSIVLANTHIAKSLNVPVERLIGKSFLDFLPPGEVRERRKAYADRTILNKKPTKLIDKRGDRYFDNYTYPVLDSNGDVIYAIAIMNEITEKKGLEASLADKEQLFSSLIQNSKDFFYVISEEGTVIYQCPSVEEKFGYAKDSKGRSIFEHIHPDDKDFVKRSFAEVLPKPGKSKMIDFRVLDSNGRIVHVEAIANNQLHNKSINGIIINARDITERVRTKQQLTKTVSYLENIINSVSELVFCLTSKGKVLLWNDQIVQLTGFSARSMIGKNLFANSIVEDKESFKTYLETCVRKLTKPYDLKIRTKHDEYRLIRIQGSVVKTDNETDRSIVFTGKDITYDTEIHGSLITGSSYLIPETSNEKAMQLLNGLLREGYTGLIITRDDSEDDLFDTVGKNRSLTTYYFSKADTVSPDDH